MVERRRDGSESLSREKEQELRRLRGEISCAECRRLKLKCDKKVPCSSCSRRGCATVCPNGTLSTGHTARVTHSDASKLYRKMHEMSERIRQLEEALRISNAQVTSESHPLLSEGYLVIKEGLRASELAGTDVRQEVLDKDTLEAFGTLSLSEGAPVSTGPDRLMGFDVSKEARTKMEEDISRRNSKMFKSLSARFPHLARAWPFEPVSLPEKEFRLQVAQCLPTWERATALCEAYLENLSWYFKAIEREQLMEDVMPLVYGKLTDGTGERRIPSLHCISLLFAVFAAGSSGDLTLPQYNEEAEMHYHLARAALGLESIFEGDCDAVTLETVQAVSLMGVYHVYSARKGTMEVPVLLLNVAYCLAGTIGIHRDPSRWGFDAKTIQRRRSLFWELFMINNMQSISSGRPTVFCSHNTDCQFPEDLEAKTTSDGTVLIGYWRWKHRFSKEVLAPINEKMCVTASLKYSDVLEMDRLVSSFARQHLRKPTLDVVMGDWDQGQLTQYVVCSAASQMVSLFIHRNLFAKAVIDYPSNPLKSPFAPSFLSAYHSAVALLRILREQFEQRPTLIGRVWLIWGHSICAAVIVASIVIRTPTLEIAQGAFVELGMAMSLFDSARSHPAVQQALPVLNEIYAKAQAAMCNGELSPNSLAPPATSTALLAVPTEMTAPVTKTHESTTPTTAPITQAQSLDNLSTVFPNYGDLFNLSPFYGTTEPESAPTTSTNLGSYTSSNGELVFSPMSYSGFLSMMDVDVGYNSDWKAFVDEQGLGTVDFGDF